MRRLYRIVGFALSAAVLAGSALAQSTTLAGVTYNGSVELQGQSLKLNGAGIRYKTILRVYTAGLYLESKAQNISAIIELPGPKRLSLTMLREVKSGEMGRLFMRGMEDNIDKVSFAKLLGSVARTSQIFSDYKTLQAGDPIVIDWIPGVGTVITVKGKMQGKPFEDPLFFQALLGIWLGERPADWKLKEALLGQVGL
jgi:hypothetical protein